MTASIVSDTLRQPNAVLQTQHNESERLDVLFQEIAEDRWTPEGLEECARCYLSCMRTGLLEGSSIPEDGEFFQLQWERLVEHLRFRQTPSKLEGCLGPDDLTAFLLFQNFLERESASQPLLEQYLFYSSFLKVIEKNYSPAFAERALRQLQSRVVEDLKALPIGESLLFPSGWVSDRLGHHQLCLFEKCNSQSFKIHVLNTRRDVHHAPKIRGTRCSQVPYVTYPEATLAFVEGYLYKIASLLLPESKVARSEIYPDLPGRILPKLRITLNKGDTCVVDSLAAFTKLPFRRAGEKEEALSSLFADFVRSLSEA